MSGTLVHKDTKKPVVKGEKAKDFTGKEHVINSWRPPSRPGASAKVTVCTPDGTDTAEYYASVLGLEWQA